MLNIYNYFFSKCIKNDSIKKTSKINDYILYHNNIKYYMSGLSPRNAFENLKYDMTLTNNYLNVEYYDINNQIVLVKNTK